ncbi:protein still life, isoforms C/SIF type 2-like isoform X2 [Ostrea edulis]|uniref:protein still life, isoforms C/SIF type 2-like isoform X2 n=1 Tax=Ostrea edulis TaxID=37623 RepID=UPI0024AFF791|nr:protein still life, isoforms C/SIF type 2-like isoform X2 [Ostrea edulis]XP_048767211.2 protein still life, isoforms C/SIF type 2-like isoform X2 [Ostrea edulis]XP_048767212.2 protein still life, isoforms C/SIF type 2-like isoform X2 [Ostrea edulis]XP_056015499.1 protein still life, isoforms C/SIF type 2-like isoform X2 [Ostrea edulis]
MTEVGSTTRNLRKLLTEILETERTYVKNIDILAVRYLRPLSTETFLTTMEIQQLSASLQEILNVQRDFLQSLESVMAKHRDVYTSEDSRIVRSTIFAVGGVFLIYAEQFKIYSSFCALYSKVKDILNAEGNDQLRHFLDDQNETKEHSHSLESFIIQPVQRILKYPLFLKQLSVLTDEGSDEHHHICKACDEMQGLANHINDMQKLNAEFGASFRQLSSEDPSIRDFYSERPHRSHAANNIPVIKSGFCTKEGAKMKSWKRRFFVLNEYGLFYYVSNESTEPLNHIPRNEMQHVRASTVNKRTGGLFGMFELHTENRTYFIESDTPDEVHLWIQSIKLILPQKRRQTTMLNQRDSIFYTPAGYLSTIKSGYCTKQGGKWKSWLSRYFVVNEDGITYFTSEQSVEALKVIPKRDVRGVQEISGSQFGRENVFEIHTCCRTFYIQCESHEDLCEWVSAIRRILPHPKIQLNVGELITHGAVEWCNITEIIGRNTHASGVISSLFVFRSGLVIICRHKNSDEEKAGDRGELDIFRSLVPAGDISLDVSTEDSDFRYPWSITQPSIDCLPKRTYKFCNSSIETRSRFVTAIREIAHHRIPSARKEKNRGPKIGEALLRNTIKRLGTVRNKDKGDNSIAESD